MRRMRYMRHATRWVSSAVAFCLMATLVGQAQEPRIPPVESASGINITRTLANHPDLSEAWLTFARYVLGNSTLPPRERELLILRIGFLLGADYEWGQHARIGREAGLTDTEILRITQGLGAAGWSSFDRTLLRAVDELRRDAEISDTTWNELAARYDTKQLMDVVFTVGQYNLVSMALKTFRVPLDEGVTGIPR